MNRCWWILPLIFPVITSAQQDSTFAPNTALQHRFSLDGIAAFDSNVLYNDLILGLYRGGGISSEVLQHSMDAIEGKGRFGYEVSGTATYSWGDSLFGHAAWMPRISAGYRNLRGLRFTRDAYALTFFGNTAYADSTAHLGPSSSARTTYQTFSFGIEDRNTGSFIELSLVNGRSFDMEDVNKADLYTAPDGRYLELKLDGTAALSDTASKGPSNGIGAAINLEWRHRTRLLGTAAEVSVGITDLGFIAWNNNSLSLTKDSTIHYDGIEVTNILDYDGQFVNKRSLQDSLGLGYSKGSFTKALPARIEGRLAFGRLRKIFPGPMYHDYEAMIGYRYLPGYIPEALITRNFILTRNLAALVGAGYGGFGGLRARAGIEFRPSERFRILVGTPNAVGLVSDQAMGKALAMRLETAW